MGDLTSSMEPIRNAALMAQTDERKKSTVNPRTSRLWAENQMLEGSFQESQGSRPAQDRTRAPKHQSVPDAMRDANKESREPRSFSSPVLRANTYNSVRSGGFQKLDWMPTNTNKVPQGRQLRSRDRHTTSKSVAPAAPPL